MRNPPLQAISDRLLNLAAWGVAALCILPGPLHAQGNLSTQGFGYPTGQTGSRALGAGTGIAEADPQSLLNPALPALWGAPVLFLQYEPEFRRTETPSGTARTTTARFPGGGFSLPIGHRYAVALSVSSFLDRTWRTRLDTTQVFGPETVDVVQSFSSDGGINDVRLALAYRATNSLSFGLGAHFFTGENRITIAHEFADTVRFSDLVEQSDISYGGRAASAGFEWRPTAKWQLAGSLRRGGEVSTEAGDSTLSRARIPNRYGIGLTYAGISGAALSLRVGREEWSSMQGLGSAGMTTFDAWDVGGGVDLNGPRVGRRVIMVRGGARRRTLPFGAAGEKVGETLLGGGFGLPLAFDRATFDVSVVRAGRSAKGRASESAYILSLALRIRP